MRQGGLGLREDAGHRPERRERAFVGAGGLRAGDPGSVHLPPTIRPADVRPNAAGGAFSLHWPRPQLPSFPTVPARYLPCACRRLNLLPAVSEREEMYFLPTRSPQSSGGQA